MHSWRVIRKDGRREDYDDKKTDEGSSEIHGEP